MKLKRLFFALVLGWGLLMPAMLAHAQSGQQASAVLLVPDASQFPSVSAWMNVFDNDGNFVSGLTPANVSLLENGELLKPERVEQFQIPLQLVVAINSGPGLAVRDGQGNSRYDKTAAALDGWAQLLPETPTDDLSLVWNGGIITSHVTPAEWRQRLESFDPAPRTSEPSLTALTFALDVAQQRNDVTGVKPAVLLLSSHIENQSIEDLNQLISRAAQAGVRVYVWMIDSAAYLDHPGSLALASLAEITGGRYQSFTGDEPLPNLDEWFSPLRSVYRLEYLSKVKETGTQSVVLQIARGELVISAPAVTIEMTVEPPNPALVSPPIQIVRQNETDPYDLQNALPASQEIVALIEFPDKHIRPLTRSALLVNGEVVDENTSEPFDRFTWDLSSYLNSAQFELQVEVTDSLGLSRTSAKVPVEIVVLQPTGGVTGTILRQRSVLAIVGVLMAGLVLAFVLLMSRQGHLPSLGRMREKRKRELDPVTQPVKALITPPPAPASRTGNPFPWLRRRPPAPPAYFAKLTADGNPAPGDPIPLYGSELTFGTDPTQATNILDHPSVSGLHARLRLDEGGQFTLTDQNSVAGTWINYEPAPEQGRILKHGDVVNFGQLTYRFVLTKPPKTPKPVVTLLKES
jgi:hypothetical protein